jgi:hypothetical protein
LNFSVALARGGNFFKGPRFRGRQIFWNGQASKW